MVWHPRNADKADAMFMELRAWCFRMDAIGPTPRLLVVRDVVPGALVFSEHSEGGPTVRVHPETVRELQEWLDASTLLMWS